MSYKYQDKTYINTTNQVTNEKLKTYFYVVTNLGHKMKQDIEVGQQERYYETKLQQTSTYLLDNLGDVEMNWLSVDLS